MFKIKVRQYEDSLNINLRTKIWVWFLTDWKIVNCATVLLKLFIRVDIYTFVIEQTLNKI